MPTEPVKQQSQESADKDAEARTAKLLAAIAESGRGNFPSIAKFLYEVRTALRKENASIPHIASLILKDFALTNSILKLVNSAFYGTTAAHRISTISRAVGLVGVDAIGNLAVALNVFESFNGLADVAQLKKLTVHSLLTAVHARELMRREVELDPEVSFISGMMSNMGRLVMAFYLPEQQAKIEQLASARRISLDEACAEVMGLSFLAIGQVMTREWYFPDEITDAISGIDLSQPVEQPTISQKLRAAISCAGELSTAASITDPREHAEMLNRMRAKYAAFIPLDEEQLNQTLKASSDRLGDLTQTLHISGQDLEIHAPALLQRGTAYRPYLSQIPQATSRGPATAWQALAAGGAPLGGAKTSEAFGSYDASAGGSLTPATLSSAVLSAVGANEPPRREEILACALDEISSSLANEAPLNDVLLMILEAMYRGIGFDHVLLALITPDRFWLRGRYCLGPRWEQLTAGFRISLRPPLSRLAQVITESREILIPDVHAALDISPDFLHLLQAQSFLLLPVVVKNVSLGAVYAQRSAGQEPISEGDQRNMRMLRNHAAMAIRHCQ